MKELLILTLAPLLFLGCAVPVNTLYDSARMIEEGKGEIGVSTAMHIFGGLDTLQQAASDTLNGNVFLNNGLFLGFHAAKRLDMRIRWEWGPFSDLPNFHFIQLATKYSIIHNRLAFSAPVGVYIFSIDPEEEITRAHWEFSPRILATLPVSERIDLSLAGKFTFITSSADAYPGFNLGLSFLSPGKAFTIDYRLDIGFTPVFPLWNWNENTQELSTRTSQFPLWSIGFAAVLQ